MFLNIITPCTRPENLYIISKSINIPKEKYRWIIVCDSEKLPDNTLIPDNCEIYTYKDPNSISGNAQRNYAIDIVKEGHIYVNDDDTILHPNLWENIKNLDQDLISFSQEEKNGQLRLKGEIIQVCHIDSHNFIVSKNLVGDNRWVLDKYEADGIFASLMNEIVINNNNYTKIFINKILSTYNSLK
jgi:hypothetical protein